MFGSSIRALFFDLDGTLRLPTPSPTDAFIEIARDMGLQISETAVANTKLWAHEYWGQDKRVKEDMDRLGANQFWIYYSCLLLDSINVQEDQLEKAKYVSNWFQTVYKPTVELAAGSYELLLQLKEAGYYLGLISNRLSPLDTAVAELGLEGLFHITLAAGEVGFWKPNPAIFHYALERFPDLEPESCVYVGDNYYADAVGARAANINPVIFDPDDVYCSFDCHRIKVMSELRALLSEEANSSKSHLT